MNAAAKSHIFHFDDYLQKNKKHSMHPKLCVLYKKFPRTIHNLKNLIFYGPSGVGKYTQMLSCIQKYSPSELKYEKRLTVNFNKEQYLIKMSDIHFEIDMSLLGCNAKLLWNEIYSQIIDVIVSSSSHNQVGIIVCTHFHKINSELLDNFYSYMQGINSMRLKYILISEHVGFIPDNIMHNCKIIHVPKPTASNYNKCSPHASHGSIAAPPSTSNKNIILSTPTPTPDSYSSSHSPLLITPPITLPTMTKTIKCEQQQRERNCEPAKCCPHESLCNVILDNLKNPDNLKFLAFRDILYDILIYNYDIGECMWYILNDLINCGLLQMDDLSDILIETYTSLQYFNNNYRPIYHLENYMYNIISRIHGYGIIKN
jgi:DNA polymerase III delta prime subunit